MKYVNHKFTSDQYLNKIKEILPYITDIKGFTTTRSPCEFFDSRPNAGWFTVKPYSLTVGYSKGHPYYSKRILLRKPLEEMTAQITELYPYIKYVDGYNGFKSKCKFLDTRVGQYFETTPYRIAIGDCKGAKGWYKKPSRNFQDVLGRVQEILPHISQMNGYTKVNDKCRFLDNRNNQWFEATPKDLCQGNGSGHPDLSNQLSKQETQVYDFINSLVPAQKRVRFGRNELDIYVPSLKIGIEYNGTYWHSTKFKDRSFHLNKTKWFADNHQIRVVHVWDYEWHNRQDQIKNYLRSALYRNNNKVFARRCDFKVIDLDIANDFCELHHIQGGFNVSKTRVSFGCFYNDQLVGVAVFGSHHRQNHNEVLLSRLCFANDTTIVGGFSKFMNLAAKQFSRIHSFVDLSKSDGKGYIASKWKVINVLQPDYFYVTKNLNYISKQSRQKKKIFTPIDMTEYQHAILDGLNRVFDCGKLKLIFES